MIPLLLELMPSLIVAAAIAAHARHSSLSRVMRYFTAQSNVLCAAASLAVGTMRLLGAEWHWALWIKYMGTVSVTVTLLTVVFFLSRIYGFKVLFSGPDLWLHLVCPLLALITYYAWDKPTMTPGAAMLGTLPVLLYGILYLVKVVLRKQWDDFYAFNRDGRWKQSFSAMAFGTVLLCAVMWLI